MSIMKMPSVLSFDRKMDVSDAEMLSGEWKRAKWIPLSLQEKTVRGTMSSRVKKDDEVVSTANIQSIDFCRLPFDSDTLLVRFSMRIFCVGNPTSCNDIEYIDRFSEIITKYSKEQRFIELGRRYAQNLANGRFLWRNRIGGDQIEIQVDQIEDGQSKETWTFNALKVPLMFLASSPASEIQSLGEKIAEGLRGDKTINLRISAQVRMGFGLDVYPSQELIINRGRGKSKILYESGGTAAMHSQKIGNALRTIDTWYLPGKDVIPIPVEPYGTVINQGVVHRPRKTKLDFYTIFDSWVNGKLPDIEQQHFAMAVLVRGGVFGEG